MLYSLGHGQHAYVERGAEAPAPVDTPLSGAMEATSVGDAPIGGPFAYYFGDAPCVVHEATTAAALDALAEAMVEQVPEAAGQDSNIPPVYTYLGQFIDHDITANTDRESGASRIDADDDLTPVPREAVVRDVLNLRSGSLRLDSLYGDGPGGGPFSAKLMRLMRFPADTAKMRLGVPSAIPGQTVPLPADPAGDLLRIGRLIGTDPETSVSVEELRSLPGELPRSFLDRTGELVPQRAVIGDARNDENLLIAQLQVAFLRFHNRTVDFLRERDGGSPEALFQRARQLVTWHYQWLIVNDFLARLCREDIRAFVLSREAPLYAHFLGRHGCGADPERLPMPIEFSVAAFRFGHTMVRSAYDHNRFFGTATDGDRPILENASLELLFRFTGNGDRPMAPGPDAPQSARLPSNWVIEWERFVGEPSECGARAARRLDTFLSPPLEELANETGPVFRHLGRRNLRRGHKLNLPSAQECLARYNRISGASIEGLSHAELLGGASGEALASAGFAEETPLWFYVLKEAEARENGERLGMFGSALIAETLVGLVINDPKSYWNAAGSDEGRWHPRDGVHDPSGAPVESIPSLLRTAGLLA